jgi:beta-mannosidase
MGLAVRARLHTPSGRGTGELEIRWDRGVPGGALVVRDPVGDEIDRIPCEGRGSGVHRVEVAVPRTWTPVRPDLYRVDVEDATGASVTTRRTGFRRLAWGRSETAGNSNPWILSADGERIPLVGINWVPIRPDYSDLVDGDYDVRLTLYRDLGFNMIRVWGGAGRERDYFYERCDELGLLVWQDLPLSSSGLDNMPPTDPDSVARMREVAEAYARDLAHHPCIAVWCGGNELSRTGIDGALTPIDFSHPMLAVIREALREGGIEEKIVPTTPSGPRYTADAVEFGRGVHHDVHGPWAHEGPESTWARYWDGDDALLRSEVGIAGSSPMDILQAHGLDVADDLERRRIWRHSAKWWMRGDESPATAWVEESQQRQARLLALATRAVLRRSDSSGILFWLGHDAFPAPLSLSLVDYWGRPKPAALSIAAEISAWASRRSRL